MPSFTGADGRATFFCRIASATKSATGLGLSMFAATGVSRIEGLALDGFGFFDRESRRILEGHNRGAIAGVFASASGCSDESLLRIASEIRTATGFGFDGLERDGSIVDVESDSGDGCSRNEPMVGLVTSEEPNVMFGVVAISLDPSDSAFPKKESTGTLVR
jgi:hypothetical protein